MAGQSSSSPQKLIIFKVRPLFFYFLVYGFLGGKNGSVGREKKKIQEALLCQVVEKSYRYMEIVIKSDVFITPIYLKETREIFRRVFFQILCYQTEIEDIIDNKVDSTGSVF